MNLTGKAALVTGGAVRLGREIALALARRGAGVAVTYHRSGEAAEGVEAELRALGVTATAVRCDQRVETEVEGAVAAAIENLGRLDVLVNSAAVFRRTPFASLDEAAWDEHLDTNLKGPFLFTRHAAPALRAHGCGKIVNIADIAGLRPWANYLAYSVAKAGLIALTQGLAVALAPEVQVNAICPGPVLWPESYDEAQQRVVLDRIPLARAGAPADVVATLLYLVEGTDYVTGAVLPVDGGRLLL